MTNHKTGTREEWRAARLDLLKTEKEHTRRADELHRHDEYKDNHVAKKSD
jgi:predicted dithiol-disulfide oxidoreductase (DUF899 family)